MFRAVEANEELVKEFVSDIRDADALEAYRSSGKDLKATILDCYKQSSECYIGYHGDDMICIFGITKPHLLSNTASPWMLSTNKLPKYYIGFAKLSKKFIDTLLEHYDLLVNYVDAEYSTTIRWLKWLGFTIEDPIPYGPKGHMFRLFYKRK